MGLDITLCRFIKKDNLKGVGENGYTIVDEILRDKMIKFGLKDFIYKEDVEYYDLEAYGINSDLRWCSTYFEDGYPVNKFVNLKHDLYPIYQKMSDLRLSLSKKKINEVKESDYLNDNELDIIKNKYGYTDSIFKENIEGGVSIHSFIEFILKNIEVTFEMKYCPTYKKETDVFYSEDEISYQRKGLNGKFYDEYTDDEYYVLSKDRMQYVYDNYVLDDYKEYFKVNFLDKFIEGEMFCTFSW